MGVDRYIYIPGNLGQRGGASIYIYPHHGNMSFIKTYEVFVEIDNEGYVRNI